MADPIIKIKRSAVAGKIPTTTSLELGELAINTYDGKLFIQQNQGGVGIGSTIIAINPWSVGVGSNTYNTYFTVGNVGIGTTNPTSSLHVVGNSIFTGIVTAQSFSGTATTAISVIGGIGSITSLNVSGISTFGTVLISSGIITATSGVVTYYGDASKLTGIPQSSIQVLYNNINIGTGTTSLNFKGTGISSITSNSGISTIVVDLQSNLDGGTPNSNYGGIDPIDGGGI